MSLRRCVLIVCLVFGLTLAAVVGSRMSAEAMAVVVGVVCGVAAGIPTSALLLLAMGRRDRQRTGGRNGQAVSVAIHRWSSFRVVRTRHCRLPSKRGIGLP
jgi:preprotein translocase subunit SecF